MATTHSIKESHRLITRIVELDEQFSAEICAYGHTRAFTDQKNSGPVALPKEKGKKVLVDELGRLTSESSNPINPSIELSKVFPIANELFASNDCNPRNSAFGALETPFESDESIMEYIRKVYTNSRNAELGTASQYLLLILSVHCSPGQFNGSLLATVFMEQSTNWQTLTKMYICIADRLVESFLKDAIKAICPDSQIEEELCKMFIRDHVGISFASAEEHAKLLLKMERGCPPWTLNDYFNDNLSKNQGSRLVSNIRKVAGVASETLEEWHSERIAHTLTEDQLQSIATHNQSTAENMQEYIHDVLESYYKVSIKRFINNISLHIVYHDLLYAESSPLNVFNSKFVHGLGEAQLEQIAGESSLVRMERERLAQDIASFRAAFDVLKVTSVKGS
ncbi:hypothetical protein PoMZ_03444 [Pyricularia oryzae]|uniref:GED domain-containing protein n=1 Tax=Pyricularia oryzae TaxID=318829 RepID=A0A4P7NAS7_PYROR|nr:hypothetical protein PoMZ_03444 [Pyricularia oryzae]